MHWLTVNGLTEHWQQAVVTARISDSVSFSSDRGFSARRRPGIQAMVSGVTDLTFRFQAGEWPIEHNGFGARADSLRIQIVDVSSDDRKPSEFNVPGFLSDRSLEINIHKTDDGWKRKQPASENQQTGLAKRHGLQGPIDDAFMDSFVFVRPTGTPANKTAGQWAAAELERAVEHWRRHFRGDARVIDDSDMTDEIIQSANIVLWGDPSSNKVLAKIADQLPVKWTKDRVEAGGKSFDAAHHAPILIYPNPLNAERYVVLNSSFTYRDYAYLNNARQVPMLPDWAVIDLRTPPGNVWPGKVAAADFFDETWQFRKKTADER